MALKEPGRRWQRFAPGEDSRLRSQIRRSISQGKEGKATLEERMKSENPEIKRLLGTEGNFGEQLGLSKDWVYRIVKHVGNYGEVFDRNLGQPLKVARGLNALWTKGGIQFAPPVR